MTHMETQRYTVVFEREEDGGYHACCPVLKGCHTQGDTLDEAEANIREAIACYLESLKVEGELVPVEEVVIKVVEVSA
jgi:predicted RNase H-like HicB family nuclease